MGLDIHSRAKFICLSNYILLLRYLSGQIPSRQLTLDIRGQGDERLVPDTGDA